MRQNVTYFSLLLTSGLIAVLFVFPYLRDIGHPGLIVPGAIFLVVLFIYGRHNPTPRRKP